jgi:hypothetical protein
MRIFNITGQEVTLGTIGGHKEGVVKIRTNDFLAVIGKINDAPKVRTKMVTDFFEQITFLGISNDWQYTYVCYGDIALTDVEKTIGREYIHLYSVDTRLNKNEVEVNFTTDLQALSQELLAKFRGYFEYLFQNFIGEVKWNFTSVKQIKGQKTTTPAIEQEQRYPMIIMLPATINQDVIHLLPKTRTAGAEKGASI